MMRCAVEGCRRAIQHPRAGLCDTHFQRRQQELHEARERRGIHETGREREQGMEATAEIELTDGQMAWWVTAAAWERRGWMVRRLT